MAVAAVNKDSCDNPKKETMKRENRGGNQLRVLWNTSNVGIDNRSRYRYNKNNNNFWQLQMTTMAAEMKTRDRRDAYYGSNDNKEDP